jgi:hypothetical protein
MSVSYVIDLVVFPAPGVATNLRFMHVFCYLLVRLNVIIQTVNLTHDVDLFNLRLTAFCASF